jgi:hypothetical protein
MKNFIIQQWPTILIIAVFLFWVGYLVVNRKWDQLRSTAYRMILQAEKVVTGTKKGQERFELVFNRVYSLIPPWLRFFILENDLREQLQDWYNDIKDYLDNGKIDNSIEA